MYLIHTPKTSLTPAISGRSLALRKLGAPQRAAIAAQLLDGEVVIKLSKQQVAWLVGVSVPYINAARRFTPQARRSIVAGRGGAFVLPAPTLPKPITDGQLVDIVKNAGVDRVLSAACTVEQTTAA